MNEFLEDLLKEYNSRDVEAIRTHLNEIEKVLDREIEGLDRTFLEDLFPSILSLKEPVM